MIVLAYVGGGAFVADYPVIYAFCSLAITVVIAYFYKYWTVKL